MDLLESYWLLTQRTYLSNSSNFELQLLLIIYACILERESDLETNVRVEFVIETYLLNKNTTSFINDTGSINHVLFQYGHKRI